MDRSCSIDLLFGGVMDNAFIRVLLSFWGAICAVSIVGFVLAIIRGDIDVIRFFGILLIVSLPTFLGFIFINERS